MKTAVYKVSRRAFVPTPKGVSVVETKYKVINAVDVATLASALKQDPNLFEVRPRELLEVNVIEKFLSVEEVAKHLVFIESDTPDDMPIGLYWGDLRDLLDDEVLAEELSEDYWSLITESVLRRAVFINSRPFYAIRDRNTSEIHFVESESIAKYGRPSPKFERLASIGFTEEASRTSGYDGDELGLLSDQVAIRVKSPDEDPIDYSVFRLEPAEHANMILEFMSSQPFPFMSKIMVEGLIGRIPVDFDWGGVPSVWVEDLEDEGSWSAMTKLRLSTLLTSDNPRSPLRQAILDLLLDSRRGERFEAWLSEYIDSVVDPNSPHYENRLARQSRVEDELRRRAI
jgi:hypothetical protein